MLSLTPFLIALCYVLAASTVQTAALPMVTHVLPDYGVALLDMPDEHLEYLRDAIDQKLGADRAPEPRHNYYPDYASLADHRTVAKREPKRYGFGLGRRSAGFSYTTSGSSGVKRLPVYNFGLGRRRRTEDNTGRLLNDAMSRRRYVFGLGKRSELAKGRPDASNVISDADLMDDVVFSNMPPHYEDNDPSLSSIGSSVHPHEYGFLDNDTPVNPNHMRPLQYEIEDPSLISISNEMHPYEYDQRDNVKLTESGVAPDKRSTLRPFGFGLGKRLPYVDAQNTAEQKKSSPLRYSFGLG